MSRVITFSRAFPAHHPKAGQPTFFVEKILNALYPDGFYFHFDDKLRELNPNLPEGMLDAFQESMSGEIQDYKVHTIRAGKRWKAGDIFSPRVWSGRPYSSKQIIFATDQKLLRVADVEISKMGVIRIDNNNQILIGKQEADLAHNDGLDYHDFLNWLECPFSGQMLIYHDKKLPY